MADFLTEEERRILAERLAKVDARLLSGEAADLEEHKLRQDRAFIVGRLRNDDARRLRDLLARAGKVAGVKRIAGWGPNWRERAAQWANRVLGGEEAKPPKWIEALPDVVPVIIGTTGLAPEVIPIRSRDEADKLGLAAAWDAHVGKEPGVDL